MASARVELRALVDEVRRGCVRYACDGGEQPSRLIEEASPRSRLLRQLAEVEVSLSGSQHVSQHGSQRASETTARQPTPHHIHRGGGSPWGMGGLAWDPGSYII